MPINYGLNLFMKALIVASKNYYCYPTKNNAFININSNTYPKLPSKSNSIWVLYLILANILLKSSNCVSKCPLSPKWNIFLPKAHWIGVISIYLVVLSTSLLQYCELEHIYCSKLLFGARILGCDNAIKYSLCYPLTVYNNS